MTRTHPWRRDILRSYGVIVDGVKLGKVPHGAGTTSFSVPVGMRRLRFSLDWRKSPEIEVLVEEGSPGHVVVCPSAGPLRMGKLLFGELFTVEVGSGG